MNTVNRFDQEEYAKIKMKEMLQEAQAVRRAHESGSRQRVAAGTALLVLTALLLIRLPSVTERWDNQYGVPELFYWHGSLPVLSAPLTLLASARDECVFIGVGMFEQDVTFGLPGLSRTPAPVTACTPEMPLGSRRR